MSSRPDLRLDWCSHKAATYAVERWHYSRTMPAGKMARIGVWEGGSFIGALLYSSSACPWLGSPYGLTQFEACELVRIALRSHVATVSRIVAIATRLVASAFPRLRLVVSYADPEHGHHGGVYQAANWVFVGGSAPKWTANGQHNRAFGTSIARATRKYGEHLRIVKHAPKYKYLYPLDDDMRRRLAPLAKPYPKRPRATSVVSDAPAVHAGEGGANPTVALQPGAD